MEETFYLITMTSKNNKTLYLGEQGKKLGWSFNYNEGLWFNFYSEAENFAKDYFKHFDKWEIKEIEYKI